MLPPEACQAILSILRPHGATFIAIFGSWAKGTARPGSDVDILVRFEQAPGLPELVRMERELSQAIGLKVDLVTEQALSPYIRASVLNDMEVLAG